MQKMERQKHQNYQQRALSRGVVAARRPVETDGQILLHDAAETLKRKIRRGGYLTAAGRIGVTVVGFGRFNIDHQRFGPPTNDITAEVVSTLSPIEVRLGRIGIYGTDTKRKLGISLISEELALEKKLIEAGFEESGFPLQQGPNRAEGYIQHVSIGLLDIDNLDYFKDPDEIEKLEALTGLGPNSVQTIILQPVSARSLSD
jgi:hypothetical protein